MEIKSFQFLKNKGWNLKEFPNLDSEDTLVLIFAAPEFIDFQEPIIQLANFYSNSKIIGCSTSGEIFGDSLFDHSITVAVIKFAKTTLKMAKAEVNHSKDSKNTGKLIAEQLKADDLHSIFILSDGLNVNGSELVQGLNTAKGSKKLIITGGLAGDGSNFKKTWTISNNQILDHYVVAVGFYGSDVHVGHASKGGWDIFGPLRRITRSESNILYELDYQPALQLYKEYLGEKASELPSSGLLYPLAINNPEAHNDAQLVRTILAIDEKEQSLVFAGDVPNGWHAQLMRANFDRLIDSANEAGLLANKLMLKDSLEQLGPVLAIDISCVGRRLLLGERTEEEIESTMLALPKGSTQIGFYSYGELSPFSVGNCELHNQTMTITTIYET
ncbi:FIST C-terminal domain-containing protein [Fluoribacter dumoffii]|uniref:FIST signal transduction protein n=1 Tax=Fluoribacter dumoffii TaxID=463 RepID=UPI0022433CC4|nr:FIST N-terminal domain-containing protein [Fluoribacter dumoffii]MCW8418979.1 FIST C-terminal domain-containing protein [Fluoribacter dumoffii]MCW8453177.1 FIST C-terminal domain-containing protein [Fluoribacter dumoffii]MCW8459602.1 FIST C-terminal domain-containing protein [Fluoribacter dumoffii]MCW8482962.1 FIST C-terminal domain-containing protein [Fluoribacter dumoffii]